MIYLKKDNIKFIIGSEIINNDSIKFNGITFLAKIILTLEQKRYVQEQNS